MVLQLENCVDVVKALYPQYDYLFLFDHSCGHDKQQPDGLNSENMSKLYGGKQSYLHDSKIEREHGYLGNFPRTLKPGDVQKMTFQPGDDGPFYLTPAQREERREDKLVRDKTVKKRLKKEELIKHLREIGIETNGTLKKLQELCRLHNLPTEVIEQKNVEGWEGKQKGLLQVLWERGFIDVNHLSAYTIDGRKDAYGVVQKETSLKHLMTNCTDFEEEESLLQSMGRRMGILVDRTPKCHCEMAGEGVEYSWGCAKNAYRAKPIGEKRGKETYRNAVRTCLSRDVISTERVRKFSQRARAYTCAYLALEAEKQTSNTVEENKINEANSIPVKIEQMVKQFKTHRCALDFDAGFINSVIMKTTEDHEGRSSKRRR